MLQLVLERRQGYDDIASLLGVSADEVRSRARAVLTDLGGEDPDADVGLTDYLLGQADPIGRADVARHLQSDPDTLDLAQRLTAQLQVIAPGAQLPQLPQGKGGVPRPASGAPAGRPKPGAGASRPGDQAGAQRAAPAAPGRGLGARLGTLRGALGNGQSRIVAALVAATLLVVAIVLVVSGVFGGDGDGGSNADSGRNVDEVPVALSAPGGGKQTGRAVFAPTGGETNQIAFRLVAAGLRPTPADNSSTYTIWLYIDDKHAYPLAPLMVAKDGKIGATRPIPAIFTSTDTGLAVLARFQKIRLSLTPTKELSALVSAAVDKRQPLVPFIGRTVLEGAIPGSVGPNAQTKGGGKAPGGAGSP
jgi:hypothetical protein